MTTKLDEQYMHEALKEAEQALASRDRPIGAVIVNQGQVIARARHQVKLLRDPTAHATVIALTQAANALQSDQLPEAVDRLFKRARELEEELGRLKTKEALAKARDLAGERIGPVTLFTHSFKDPMDHAGLRLFVDAIRTRDPEAVIFLSDRQGFCVAVSGGTAQKRGILANQILRISTEAAGGSGGGKADLAQGRLKEPSRFPEIRAQITRYIQEQAKIL